MDAQVKTLIELYSQHSVSEINNPETGGPLLANALKMNFMEIFKAPWFINNKEIVEGFKLHIEDIQKKGLGSKDQIKRCLMLIRNRAFNNILENTKYVYRMEIYLELVKACFKKSWTNTQLEYFSTLGEKFSTYNSYFLSYTNHAAPIINQRYKPVFQGVLNQDDMTPDDLEDKNLVARTLVYHLQLRNLKRGFFDVDSIHKGQQIDPVLDHHVTRTFAFVQLVSLASFENRDPNYSYYEFQKYYQTNCSVENSPFKKMLYFLVLDDKFPDEDLMPPEYLHWLQLVKEVNHWKVYECGNSSAFAEVADKLVREIMFGTSALIDAAPEA